MSKPLESLVRTGHPFKARLPKRTAGGGVRLLAKEGKSTGLIPRHTTLEYGALAPLAVGTVLYADNQALLRITDRLLLSSPEGHAESECLAKALASQPESEVTVTPRRDGFSLAWVVLSDKGAAGRREDTSGPSIEAVLRENLSLGYSRGFLIPDHPGRLRALVADLALHQGYDLIVTSGGTGLSSRDTTPEALLPLIDRRLPGFEQAMMNVGLAKTPHAAISRACAGTLGHSILLTLPGSKKAVQENLLSVAPALFHALANLQGDESDC